MLRNSFSAAESLYCLHEYNYETTLVGIKMHLFRCSKCKHPFSVPMGAKPPPDPWNHPHEFQKLERPDGYSYCTGCGYGINTREEEQQEQTTDTINRTVDTVIMTTNTTNTTVDTVSRTDNTTTTTTTTRRQTLNTANASVNYLNLDQVINGGQG